MAERTGLKPATPVVTGRYSNKLNYLGFSQAHKDCLRLNYTISRLIAQSATQTSRAGCNRYRRGVKVCC